MLQVLKLIKLLTKNHTAFNNWGRLQDRSQYTTALCVALEQELIFWWEKAAKKNN